MEEIFRILKEGTSNQKSEVWVNLQDTEDISLIRPLITFLENEKVRAIKERILEVLTKLIPISKYKEVDLMLRSSDPFVRNGVVEIIKKSEIPIINFLEKLAEDGDKDVRKFVIDSLSHEKSEKSIQIIRNRCKDPEVNIVYTAIEYLGNFKDADSVDLMEDILFSTTTNSMLICSSLEALSKIRLSPRKKQIIERFTKANKPMLTFPLLKYLSSFGDVDTLDYIEGILDRNAEIFLKEIIDAVEGVVKVNDLKDLPKSLREKLMVIQEQTDNNVNKYKIIKLLSRAGGADNIKKIREMLNNDHVMIQLCAIELLGDIGDDSDIERLEDFVADTESEELLGAVKDAVMKIDKRLNT